VISAEVSVTWVATGVPGTVGGEVSAGAAPAGPAGTAVADVATAKVVRRVTMRVRDTMCASSDSYIDVVSIMSPPGVLPVALRRVRPLPPWAGHAWVPDKNRNLYDYAS
jgi:hypothetical protein